MLPYTLNLNYINEYIIQFYKIELYVNEFYLKYNYGS